MYNQIRAEFYKLFHTKALYLTFALILAVFGMLTKALIDRLINKVYVFPGDRIEIEYATQDFLETKESEKEV